MRKSLVGISLLLVIMPAIGSGPPPRLASGDAGAGNQPRPDLRKIEIEAAANTVGRFEKLELIIHVDARYDNPFDPDQVDVAVLLKAPGGEQLTVPAFYCQDYERRKLNQGRERANWYYPASQGGWKARFAPMQTGPHVALAQVKDRTGTIQSKSVGFDCVASSATGFLRPSREDPRFLEFTDGTPFFAIGQNLAFIGEGQYVNLTKAEEVFGRLHDSGANFARIWTCCQDWAMAIEARKSAWDRSWQRSAPTVPVPGSENDPSPHKCVRIEGKTGRRSLRRLLIRSRFGPRRATCSAGDSWRMGRRGCA